MRRVYGWKPQAGMVIADKGLHLRLGLRRASRIVAGPFGMVAVCVLASFSDVAPGLNLDQVRLLAWRVVQWVQKGGKGMIDKLPAYQKSIDKAKEKMAAEKERLRQLKARETERLYKVVGEVCCKAAARADFGPLLKAVLAEGTDQRTQDFLREKGVL